MTIRSNKLPEAQITVAEICDISYTEMAPSSTKYSMMEAKLVF